MTFNIGIILLMITIIKCIIIFIAYDYFISWQTFLQKVEYFKSVNKVFLCVLLKGFFPDYFK